MKGLLIKNERQKISISVEKKDAVTEEKLEGVIFGLYAKEDILSQQGEVLVEKDTLLEKKATDEKGQLTFDSDLYHGKYYVKEEVRKPGYLPNEEIWEIDASYIDQNLAEIKLTKEVENQPTKSQFTKPMPQLGKELEGDEASDHRPGWQHRGRVDQHKRTARSLWTAGRNVYAP